MAQQSFDDNKDKPLKPSQNLPKGRAPLGKSSPNTGNLSASSARKQPPKKRRLPTPKQQRKVRGGPSFETVQEAQKVLPWHQLAAEMNTPRKPRVPQWLFNSFIWIDTGIHIVLSFVFAIYMFCMIGQGYGYWVENKKSDPESPKKLLQLVLNFLQFIFRFTLFDWGKTIGIRLFKGNPYGGPSISSTPESTYMLSADPDGKLLGFFFGLFILVAKILISLWLLKYFFIYVMPINLAQAFLRGGFKWMIGYSGSLFVNITDSFIP